MKAIESETGRDWRHELDLAAVEREWCREGGTDLGGYYSTENVGLAGTAPGELAITYDLWGWQESRDKPVVRQTIRLARLREA